MGITRRKFLQAAAGSSALLAVGAAADSVRKLIPYAIPPEQVRPGVWSHYATTCRECPAGCGMHLRVIDGRPVNASGNPDHPINRGGLCARGQSCVQGLYDPDRLRGPMRRDASGVLRPAAWPDALSGVAAELRRARGRVRVLGGMETGTLADLLCAFARAFDSGRPLFYEPFSLEAVSLAHQRVFGVRGIPRYRLDDCRLIVSFAADFLDTWASPVEFARAFADARSPSRPSPARMVYVGPRLSLTAANADEFIRVPPGGECLVARAMLGGSSPPPGIDAAAVRSLARMFMESPSSVALAGPAGSASDAALCTAEAAAALNARAGRVGNTLDFSRIHALSGAATAAETQQFFSDVGPGDVVIIHNANPAFTRPEAEGALRRAGTVVYLGTLADETAELASWVLPIDSPLESWGDYEPWTGLHGLMQPTISRLYDTRPAGDILLSLAAAAGNALSPGTFEEWLSGAWRTLHDRLQPGTSWEEFRAAALRAGGAWETPAPVKVETRYALIDVPPAPSRIATDADGKNLALWAWPSMMLYDGRAANRGWLQEAPDPTSTVVWGSCADLHPKTAQALGVGDNDVIELRRGEGVIEVPVRVTEDVVEGVAAVAFGQGHASMGRHAADRGANVFRLTGPADPGRPFGRVAVRSKGARRDVIRTCATQDQHGRGIVLWAALADVAAGRLHVPEGFSLPLKEGYDPARDVYAGHDHRDHRWAMVVDLDRCIGCGACAVACYAENNIPVIGPEQVSRSRVMAWLRVVPYRDLSDNGRMGFLPLMCQQCDSAPCESVCPVFASAHSEEGLNAQVYNRCIGTRYCSNNCPYKVRRFNWLNWDRPEPLALQLNPEVTVRVRGVMEKCTFCIQRIRGAELAAKRENRRVRDGEIRPACAESCPTRAIYFGDLLDAGAEVTLLTRADPRRYHVLEEQRTKPGVTYLQRIRRDAPT